MSLEGIKIGIAITGSHCTIDEVIPQFEKLKRMGAVLYPILSESVDRTDTRFGTAEGLKEKINKLTDNPVMSTIVEAEPVGPEKMLDVIVVAPCTGNTMAKLANAITDSTVLMAVKAHLRNQRPVILAVSTNDGLSLNAKNLGLLINAKNIFMVPFGQDNPDGKPNSLKSRMELLVDTIEKAMEGKQLQPVLRSY